MKKFFLFRQEAVNAASTKISDTGLGLSLFAVPVEKLSFMTATLGEIQMVFDDTTFYQQSGLFTGEAIEKAAVSISCFEGDEIKAMDDIIKFMSSEGKTNRFMRFDASTGGFTSKFVDTSKGQTVVPRIKANPINMQTGERSFGDATTIAANTIAGINFNYTQPLIDYNHEGLASFSNAAEITSWANAGSGGSTYNISSNVGDPHCSDPATEDRGLAFKSAQFAAGDHFIVPTAKFNADYTLYFVITTQYTATNYSDFFHLLYGDSDGQTLGPGGSVPESGNAGKIDVSTSKFTFRHHGQTGAPAQVTMGGPILQNSSDEDFDPCHVFVIRRTADLDIFVHDRNGTVIAEIPRGTRGDGSTSGQLRIERLGTTADVVLNHFAKSSLARFGVINQDIGYNESVRVAESLYKLYSNQ
jgi:hypothetical protein